MLNSYDDFTPLSEIVVGSAAHYVGHDRDVTFELFFHEALDGYRSDWAYPRLVAGSGQAEQWTISKRYAEELHEDVENLAATLTDLGITVHRPLPLPEDAQPIGGLGWQAAPTPRPEHPRQHPRPRRRTHRDGARHPQPLSRDPAADPRLPQLLRRRRPLVDDAPAHPHRRLIRPVLRPRHRHHTRRPDRTDHRPAVQPV
ncbi:hypothetical protein [Streptomyces canus]|uniref:hypothetical protein n=1 Tax=Streptomyces canus TaxID=58343 RepID=UPI0027D8D381|nr:hypothetical protein [Streptomyces canus]